MPQLPIDQVQFQISQIGFQRVIEVFAGHGLLIGLYFYECLRYGFGLLLLE